MDFTIMAQEPGYEGEMRIRRPSILPILCLVAASVLGVLLAACARRPVPAAAGILDGQAQATTLVQVKQAINDLYDQNPGINSFVVQAVTYTPETRDKVLKICSEGGLAANEQERETQKIFACAPLIFFFYNYGQQNSVPESADVARQLYWYAMTGKSDEAKKALTGLLRGWGIP